MKSFRKWAGIIALMMAAIFALVTCDLVKGFMESEYPEFPENLRGNWKREAGGTDTRRITTNTFSGPGLPNLLLSKITGDNYSLRTPAGSTPDITTTKTLVIENSKLVISGCTEACGNNCDGIWIK